MRGHINGGILRCSVRYKWGCSWLDVVRSSLWRRLLWRTNSVEWENEGVACTHHVMSWRMKKKGCGGKGSASCITERLLPLAKACLRPLLSARPYILPTTYRQHLVAAGGIQSGNCCQNTSIKLGTTRVCSFPLSAVGQGHVAGGGAIANVHCEAVLLPPPHSLAPQKLG